MTAEGWESAAQNRVCVVATQPATFERCLDGIYPVPESYDRADVAFEYMAFYRTAPISAITHYARVTDRTSQIRGEDGPLDEQDWAATVDPFTDTSSVVVFEFEKLVPLEPPIENDMQGLRGAWYCTLDALKGATTLSEIAD